MKNVVNLLVWFTLLLIGCSEVFDPQISANKQILVVDGMITNVAETYIIKLSYASPYNSTATVTPVTNAVVNINDDVSNEYSLTDIGNGTYVSNPYTFNGVIGRTYTLHIKTSDGTIYQSAPQFLEQTFPIDSIYGSEIYDPGAGVRSFVNLNIPNGFTGYFRLMDSLIIEAVYTKVATPTNLSKEVYYWYYAGLDNVINLAESGSYNTTSGIVDHEIPFFLLDKASFGIPDTLNILHRFLNVKVYGINNDTYNIYNSMNGQLVTGTQLFDPIVTQVQGNITCTSDPVRIVLGKFEASSYIQYFYKVVTTNDLGHVQYFSFSKTGTIP